MKSFLFFGMLSLSLGASAQTARIWQRSHSGSGAVVYGKSNFGLSPEVEKRRELKQKQDTLAAKTDTAGKKAVPKKVAPKKPQPSRKPVKKG